MARKTKESAEKHPRKTQRAPKDLHALVTRAVDRAIAKFQAINKTAGLSEKDKDQLKETYLKNCFAAEGRRILKLKLPAHRPRKPNR
jgi:hypothetical protein